MNGRIYAVNRDRGIAAIETEHHGFTIIELAAGQDVEVGDQVDWDSELDVGANTYNNLSTKRPLSVIVHHHLVSQTYIRQILYP